MDKEQIFKNLIAISIPILVACSFSSKVNKKFDLIFEKLNISFSNYDTSDSNKLLLIKTNKINFPSIYMIGKQSIYSEFNNNNVGFNSPIENKIGQSSEIKNIDNIEVGKQGE